MQHANAKQVAGISRKRTTIGLRMFFLILNMSLDALLASGFTYETYSIWRADGLRIFRETWASCQQVLLKSMRGFGVILVMRWFPSFCRKHLNLASGNIVQMKVRSAYASVKSALGWR